MRLSFADGLFWSSVACCLIAQLLILRSVRGSHGAAEPRANMPRQRSGLELVWALLPAVGLAMLLYFTWHAIHPLPDPAPSAPAGEVRA